MGFFYFCRMGNVFRLIRILSLDVVCGACVSAGFIARLTGVSLPVSSILCLGMVVWLVYTVDHLLDGLKIPHKPGSIRHFFHKKFFKPIAVVWLVFLVFSLFLVAFLPYSTLISGILLALLVGCYFLLIWVNKNKPLFYKEIAVAFLYSCGVFLPAVSLDFSSLSPDVWFLFFQFFCLALFNLITFAVYEQKLDRVDGHSSIVVFFGPSIGNRILNVLAFTLIIMVLVRCLIFSVSKPVIISQGVILVMIICLWLLHIKKAYFITNERYRTIGDMVFLLPLMALLFL
jgi:4-hydroxybenzoate polyprenyltransferase